MIGNLNIGLRECPVTKCVVKIGNNIHFSGRIDIRIYESETEFIIGNDCLFSDNISIWASDSHSIFDDNGNLVNRGRKIIIGNHVWVGLNVSILKNVIIPDGCIIGMNSTVTSGVNKTIEPNCIIAGNPSRIVKRNINWKFNRPNEYIK